MNHLLSGTIGRLRLFNLAMIVVAMVIARMVIAAIVIAAIVIAPLASAHGGGEPQLSNAPAGPYLVSVWTQPQPPRAGQALHLTIALSEATADNAAGAPVLDAGVTVAAVLAGRPDTAVQWPATHDNAANRLFYETDFVLPEAGQWAIAVRIDGPAGAAHVDFNLLVDGDGGQNRLWLGATGFIVVAAFWFLRRSRRWPHPVRET